MKFTELWMAIYVFGFLLLISFIRQYRRDWDDWGKGTGFREMHPPILTWNSPGRDMVRK